MIYVRQNYWGKYCIHFFQVYVCHPELLATKIATWIFKSSWTEKLPSQFFRFHCCLRANKLIMQWLSQWIKRLHYEQYYLRAMCFTQEKEQVSFPCFPKWMEITVNYYFMLIHVNTSFCESNRSFNLKPCSPYSKLRLRGQKLVSYENIIFFLF